MSAVLSLDPNTIDRDFAGRIGLYFPAKAEALGALMKHSGQTDPIRVTKRKLRDKFEYRLVYGLHRLEGAILAGINVLAIETDGSDAELEAMQASENVNRRELEPLERALFVHAVAMAAKLRVMAEHGVESMQALGGKAKANRAQYSEIEKADEVAEAAVDNLSIAYGWKSETAEALGLGLKDIQRSMRIHRCIIGPFSELIYAFKDHPVAKVADSLLTICKINEEAQRRRVIELLIAGPKDLDYALRHVGLLKDAPYRSDYDKWSSQVLGGWSRMETAAKRKFIPELVAVIPVGMRAAVVEEIERLNAAAGGAK
jgi:ParB family transcriptional regulator, chromosome partitioning protein